MVLIGDPTDLDALRLRNEFLSMPGLSLTLPQAARLLGVRLEHARAMLDELEHEGFLLCGAEGDYRRVRVDCAGDLEHAGGNL